MSPLTEVDGFVKILPAFFFISRPGDCKNKRSEFLTTEGTEKE
jgi:hypothetical protein